jgi:inner membrane protein
MANNAAHRLVAAVALFTAQAAEDASLRGRLTGRTLVAASGGFAFGTLPDLIEPAFRNPNHRKFYHSVLFAMTLGAALYQVYEWKPENDSDRFFRGLMLVMGSAYLVHLAMDATTTKSLPLI